MLVTFILLAHLIVGSPVAIHSKNHIEAQKPLTL